MAPMPPLRVALAAALVSSLMACGSGVTQTARRGDQAALATALRARIDDGSLTRGDAADVAEVVLERELRAASGAALAARFREIVGCANPLSGVLSNLEDAQGELGALAAWTRARYGDMGASEARRYARHSDERRRGIAAFGLVRDEDADARRHAMVARDANERRAALRASLVARDAGDVEALAEAARLDPDMLARTDALRALMAIGGPKVATKLRDLWTGGDTGLRGDLGLAWASPGLFPHGGEAALVSLLTSERGAGAIEAAAGVLRARSDGGDGSRSAPSPALRALAVAFLSRTLSNDVRRGRLHAVAIAPLPRRGAEAPLLTPLLEAIRALAKEDDLELRVAALSRLLESESDRAAATRELEVVGGRPQGPLSRRALFALAGAGHRSIQAWLERDLVAPDPEARLSALLSLVALDRGPRGATLLADQDPSVRTRAACLLLAAGDRPKHR